MQWDLFCRVIDNHGDLGVCWRLAADLASRGEVVRLWVDDASALAWMAPQGAPGVMPRPWGAAENAGEIGEVVVEAFGCELPQPFVARMAARRPAPVWINLEYLSAEPYVERSHRLPSPQRNGLTKWFFYPGFSAATGGLLREPALLEQQAGFDGRAWLAGRGWAPRDGERVASLFCYDGAPVGELLQALTPPPTLLLATPGPATRRVEAAPRPAGLRVIALPWLTQADYDRLLWACDLNLVRGEDSFVRAQWAGRPFLWHIYPQQDGAHHAKLDAFLARYLAEAPAPLARSLRSAATSWVEGRGPIALPDASAWARHTAHWREQLLRQTDLTTQLIRFVDEKR